MLLLPRMFEVREKPDMIERALLVRFYFDAREATESESLLEELAELVSTLGVEVVESVLYRSREMHKKFLCGTGKASMKSSSSPAPTSAMSSSSTTASPHPSNASGKNSPTSA